MRHFLTFLPASCLLVLVCSSAQADVMPLWGTIPLVILMTWDMALLLTLIIETAVVMTAARHWKVSLWRGLAAGLVPSMLTHPPAWYCSKMLGPDHYLLYILILEVIITLIESTMLKKILKVSWRRALLLSVCANGASALVGFLL